MARRRSHEDRCASGTDCQGAARASQGRIGAVFHAACGLRAARARPLDTQGILEAVKGIADTGFLVAFANRDDDHHDWAVSLAARVTDPLLTCEAVLAETAFHLQSVDVTLGLVAEGLVTVSFACIDHLPQLAGLAKRFADRKPDLADLC